MAVSNWLTDVCGKELSHRIPISIPTQTKLPTLPTHIVRIEGLRGYHARPRVLIRFAASSLNSRANIPSRSHCHLRLHHHDDDGCYPTFGKVAMAGVVGNEDGAHHVTTELYQGACRLRIHDPGRQFRALGRRSDGLHQLHRSRADTWQAQAIDRCVGTQRRSSRPAASRIPLPRQMRTCVAAPIAMRAQSRTDH